jgi:hypothetical protein
MAFKQLLFLTSCTLLLAACTEADKKLVNESFKDGTEAISSHFEKEAKAEAKAIAKAKKDELAKKKAALKAQKQKQKLLAAASIAAVAPVVVTEAATEAEMNLLEQYWLEAQNLFAAGDYEQSNARIELLLLIDDTLDPALKHDIIALQQQNDALLFQREEADLTPTVEEKDTQDEAEIVPTDELFAFFELDETANIDVTQYEANSTIYTIALYISESQSRLIGLYDTNTGEFQSNELDF